MSRTDPGDRRVKRRKLSNGSVEQGDATASRVATNGIKKDAVVSQNGHASPGKPSDKMHVQDVLDQVTPKASSRFRRSVEAAQIVADAIMAMPAQTSMGISEAVEFVKQHDKVAIPFPEPRPSQDSKLKFEFPVPSTATLQSPPAQSLSFQSTNSLTVNVQMPQSLFQEKDYLNLRAFHKRAFYLAIITVRLKTKFSSRFSMQYSYSDELSLTPVLLLESHDTTLAKGLHIRVNVTFPSEICALTRTTPAMNCVREVSQPTPFYNSCLRYQASRLVFDQLIVDTCKRSAAYLDSCRLGEQWLKQRGFTSSLSGGGFGGQEWSIVCGLLLTTGGPRGKPLFSIQYSALQIFKAMLQTLATRDMCHPWVVRGQVEIESSELPTLYDAETGVNLLFKMTASAYTTLRQEAQLSLTIVNSKTSNSLADTFFDHVALPYLQYDEVYTVGKITTKQSAATQVAAYSQILEFLKRGLGDRVRSLDVRPFSPLPWDPTLPRPKSAGSLQILLRNEPKHASRVVDHGPSAEDQEAAAEFQKFWGDRAELRRFKDGSITESIIWDSSEPVTKQIIQHLLGKHTAIDPEALVPSNLDLGSVLTDSTTDATEYFSLVDQTYQTLSSTLLGISGMPLPIRSVSPASELLSSSALQAGLKRPVSDNIDVLIEFDSSGRWPDSLPAIQHTKIAFLVKLGDVLVADDSSLSTRVGLENTDSQSMGIRNASFLDVIYPAPREGMAPIVFRLRIKHEREVLLLQSTLNERDIPPQGKEALIKALANYKREMIAATSHCTALRVLMTKFPALSTTIRLLKAWSCAHLLAQHIPNQALELIACQMFLAPSPYSTPASPTTAFLRCLLFLSRWDWGSTPLIVDLSVGGDMSVAEKSSMTTRFQAWRRLDPAMNQVTWFIGSSVDDTGTVWTARNKMEKVIAGRMQALASACLGMVRDSQGNFTAQTVTSLFMTPLDGYDFLITLDKSIIASRNRASKSKDGFRNLMIEPEITADTIGFDPVQELLTELNEIFGNTALFLYGSSTNSDTQIAGLWRPGVQGIKDWRVRLGWSGVPHVAENEAEKATLNKDAVLKEIELVGKDMIKSVRVLH